MQNIIDAVKAAVQAEYDNIKDKTFNSHHEAYAVIKEEFEEAEHELNSCQLNLKTYWNYIKQNEDEDIKMFLKYINQRAINAASELIQVAACAEKAIKQLP